MVTWTGASPFLFATAYGALAEHLGVGIVLLTFDAAAKSVEAVKGGQADIGFFAIGSAGQRPHPIHFALRSDRGRIPCT